MFRIHQIKKLHTKHFENIPQFSNLVYIDIYIIYHRRADCHILQFRSSPDFFKIQSKSYNSPKISKS